MRLFDWNFCLHKTRWPWTTFGFDVRRHRYKGAGIKSIMIKGFKRALYIDQDHLEEVEVCNACGEIVTHMGPDGISVCDEGGCGVVEGSTRSITVEEWEASNQ